MELLFFKGVMLFFSVAAAIYFAIQAGYWYRRCKEVEKEYTEIIKLWHQHIEKEYKENVEPWN